VTDKGRGGILFKHFDTPNRQRIDVYEQLGGYGALRKAVTEMTPDQVVQEIDASGLKGRGGAGFPAGKKASFLPHGDIAKYLCCNADESEPGAFKDRELMHRNPHQLIEGVMITAYGAGIRHAFIYIRGEYREQA
jgi:NADH-quinone oxidoreductase subunit F